MWIFTRNHTSQASPAELVTVLNCTAVYSQCSGDKRKLTADVRVFKPGTPTKRAAYKTVQKYTRLLSWIWVSAIENSHAVSWEADSLNFPASEHLITLQFSQQIPHFTCNMNLQHLQLFTKKHMVDSASFGVPSSSWLWL